MTNLTANQVTFDPWVAIDDDDEETWSDQWLTVDERRAVYAERAERARAQRQGLAA